MSQYSDGYSDYGAYGDDSQRPPRSGGCFRGCLIAAAILFLIVAALVGAGYWFFNQIMKGITQDPVEVMRRLKEQFPTAELPPGYMALAGFRMRMIIELDLLIFAKGQAEIDEEGEVVSGDAMLLFRAKVPGDQPQHFAFDQVSQNQRLVEKRPYPLRVDGYEFEASWQKTVDRDQKTRVQIAVDLHPDTRLVMQGDAERVDEKALLQFLKSIAPACRLAKRVQPGKDGDRPADQDVPKARDNDQQQPTSKKDDPPTPQLTAPEKNAVPGGTQSAPAAPNEKKPKPELPPPKVFGLAPAPPVQGRTVTGAP